MVGLSREPQAVVVSIIGSVDSAAKPPKSQASQNATSLNLLSGGLINIGAQLGLPISQEFGSDIPGRELA